jgi:hypothetical protein
MLGSCGEGESIAENDGEGSIKLPSHGGSTSSKLAEKFLER